MPRQRVGHRAEPGTAARPPGLLAAGLRPELPTCWLAEGLRQYLQEADVLALFDRVTALSAPGSHLLTETTGISAYGKALGRWPHPDAPGSPQGYLVHGTR